ncbi:MAG: HlyD family secretion protein [Candidatus Midichloriaceae bacterium]|jgi:HlyD family type I secretion membrane fusion protein|nr:HlyD family secretion protein [Candidatus Midichloriaceae bacterium]
MMPKKIKTLIASFFQKISSTLSWFNEAEYFRALHKFMTTKSLDDTGFSQKVEKDLRLAIAAPIKFGFAVIGIGLAIFVVWGGTAPLDSAALAEGIVSVAGHRKTVQHLEGGVIEKILVEDGQMVKEGEVLIKLNDANTKSQKQIISSQLNFANAMYARLLAEQSGADQIIWDEKMFDFSDPEIKQILQTQEHLFKYRMNEMHANYAILNERIAQSQEEIIGLEARKASYISQSKLIAEELKNTEELFAKGLALRPRLLELRRHADELTATLAETKSRIASAREAIAENKLRILNIENERQKEIAREIKETHQLSLDLTEKYNAISDVVERSEIKSPVDGIVTDMQYHTIGGVITSGHKILDIIPQDGNLIVEAKVKLQDIDSIYPGLLAKVQLGAYKSRLVPRIEGKVIYVSADKSTDQQGNSFYITRIEIDEAQFNRLSATIKLHPGMPVTVFIVKGTRTFLEYLISPIRDSFFKAFKET